LRAAEEPRRFAPEADAALTLTIPALGVYNAPIFDSDSPDALSRGVGHVPETSMPWDEGAQRNVYLAAHRVGYQGAGGRLLFYNLGELGSGDEVILEGRGQTYRYRVTETLVVDPEESWVMGHVRGRDIVSLQTCTPIPTFEKRLIVRADRA
jgi:sortase A